MSAHTLAGWQVREIESIKLNARERDPSLCPLLSIRCEPGAGTSRSGKAASCLNTACAGDISHPAQAVLSFLCPSLPQTCLKTFLPISFNYKCLTAKPFFVGFVATPC